MSELKQKPFKKEIHMNPHTMSFCKVYLYDKGTPVTNAQIVITKKE